MLQYADQEESGLRSFILQRQKDHSSTPSLMVIMAGTNDLADEIDATPIAERVSELHKLCWECGVARTVAIGVPPSAYQTFNKDAAGLCSNANKALKEFCESHSRASYLPFPFRFDRDDRWAPDGLHLTGHGYTFLGKQLAPAIAELLSSA